MNGQSSDLSALKRRIAKLREKTTSRGCTEAEAMAAAEMVAKLMADYKISENDIEIGQSAVASKTAGRSTRDLLWDVLAYSTNTVMMLRSDSSRWSREFIGRSPGPEVATYLYVVLDRAIDREIRSFKAGSFYRQRRNRGTRTQAVRDFTIGLVSRLAVRLKTLFAGQGSAADRARAIAARSERYPESITIKNRVHEIRFNAAATAGSHAGETINLSHGLDETHPQTPYQIGGGR